MTVHLAAPLDGAGLDAVARIALVVRRLGWRLEVQPGGVDLDPLLALAGLLEVLEVLEGRL